MHKQWRFYSCLTILKNLLTSFTKSQVVQGSQNDPSLIRLVPKSNTCVKFFCPMSRRPGWPSQSLHALKSVYNPRQRPTGKSLKAYRVVCGRVDWSANIQIPILSHVPLSRVRSLSVRSSNISEFGATLRRLRTSPPHPHPVFRIAHIRVKISIEFPPLQFSVHSNQVE